MIIGQAFLFIAVAVNALPSTPPSAGGLAIESRVMPDEAPFGEPMRLRVELRNAGDEPILLLVRDANFVVEVESAEGHQTITIPRYTRRATRFKDDEVPLRPGDAFTRHLPVQLNDIHAMPGAGWLPEPGTYRIRLRYDSEHSVPEHTESVLRVTAVSDWTRIRVLPPTEQQQIQRLHEIESCSESDECDAIDIANFYRVVVDRRAADPLLRLLERHPLNIWLLDAIVAQRRASDGKRLRELSSQIADPAIRQRFVDAAAKLER